MNDRRRAIEILCEARDELSRRLVERVLHSAGELLDEARGDSYGGEIDSIHDQLASRLASINAMLIQIQSLPEPSLGQATELPADIHRVTTAGVSFETPLGSTNVFAESSGPALPPASGASLFDSAPEEGETMDKKAKKRIDVLQVKLQTLRMQLAGSKRQMDDPAEVQRLEKEIAASEAELAKLKAS